MSLELWDDQYLRFERAVIVEKIGCERMYTQCSFGIYRTIMESLSTAKEGMFVRSLSVALLVSQYSAH